MQKRIDSRIGLVTLTVVILIGAISYANGNSDAKPVAVSSSSAGGPSMQQSANTSNQQNNAAGALSKVIGAAKIGLGASQIQQGVAKNLSWCKCGTPLIMQGILNIGMGGQAFMQASEHGGAAAGAALTGVDTSAWNNPFGNPNSPNLLDPGVDATKDKDLIAAVDTRKFNDLKTKLLTSGIGGVRIDPKSGKIIDSNTGKTFDMKQMADPAAMAQAGFSSADIAQAMDSAAKIEKAAMKKLGLTEGIGSATAENGYTDGGGQGVNSGTMTGDSSDVSGFGGRGLASGGSGIRIPSSQIAGLTKNFNGERIGVPAENIFNMMARRYKTKEKQNSFFDPAELVKMPQ